MEGAGVLKAVDNGNAATTESFQGDSRTAFNGMALLIVESLAGKGGDIRIRANSQGLEAAALNLTSRQP